MLFFLDWNKLANACEDPSREWCDGGGMFRVERIAVRIVASSHQNNAFADFIIFFALFSSLPTLRLIRKQDFKLVFFVALLLRLKEGWLK